MQRPPLTPVGFRGRHPQTLTVEKLRASLTDWLSVADKELEQEYRRRNDKVKLAGRQLRRRQLPRRRSTATDRGSRARTSTAHTDDFKIPEKRKIRYHAHRHRRGPRQGRRCPPADIERAYNDNLEQYSTPEQVRASHILLKTEGKDDAAVKAQGRRRCSSRRRPAPTSASSRRSIPEDEGSAKNGGDLDYFARGKHGARVRCRSAFTLQAGPDQRAS